MRRRPHRRQGPRQGRRREGQLRAGLRRHRQGDRARRGLLGPPDRRRAEGPRPRGRRTRRCGRSASRRCGRSSSRSTRSSTRSAGRCARGAKYKEFGGSWIYGMNREGETPKVSIGFVAGLDYTDARLLRPRRAAGVQAAPARAQDPRGRQARGLGREGDPRGRLLGDAHAARARAWSIAATPAAWSTCRKLKGIHYAIESGHARRGDDLPRSSRPARPTSRPTRRRSTSREIGKDLYESRNMKQPFAQGA